eukprot:7898871-Pyramimonas_sp.AAC.1
MGPAVAAGPHISCGCWSSSSTYLRFPLGGIEDENLKSPGNAQSQMAVENNGSGNIGACQVRHSLEQLDNLSRPLAKIFN